MPLGLSPERSIMDRLRDRFRVPFEVHSSSDGHAGHVFWRSPLRPRIKAKPSKITETRVEGCCVEERERWRQQQRAQGLICIISKTIPADRPESPASRTRTTRSSTKATISFLDLPPEIRTMVYQYYFRAHESSPERLTPFILPTLNASNTYPPGSYYKPAPPHDPALCLTTRVLRRETRPLFFRTHRFPIPIHLEPPHPTFLRSNPYTTVSWYRRLDPSLLRLIRHLEIHFCFEKADRVLNKLRAPDALLFDVDLHESTNTFTIASSRNFATGPYGRGLVDLAKLEGHVRDVLTQVLRRKGVGELDWGDYEALVPWWK
nr:hypothetical protein CFP56_09411 [Quercus suber]